MFLIMYHLDIFIYFINSNCQLIKPFQNLFTGPISGFAFNADQSQLVSSDSSEAAYIFRRDGSGKYTKETG